MKKNYDYHVKQFENIKRSTVFFVEYLRTKLNFDDTVILDMACGGGANTNYLGDNFPKTNFIGLDFEGEFLNLHRSKNSNVKLEKADWYNLDDKYINAFDGIISFQTLSWLPDYKEPIQKLCALNPNWIAMSSLFYEGKINFYINLDDHEGGGESYYNVYSLPLVKKIFAECGYTHFEYIPFNIDIDLPKPAGYEMGTYTVKTEEDKRLQISGALLMPWYFILARK